MIRDPSDGTVREDLVHRATESASTPIGHPAAENASPLHEQIKAALLAGKVSPEKLSEQWAYQRAWNDGIDFSLKQVAGVFKTEQGA